MSENTPPHARLELQVHNDLRIGIDGLENSHLSMTGCFGCLAVALASFMIRNPDLYSTIITAVAIAATQNNQNEK